MKNKARWYKTRWWKNSFEYDEKIDFGIAERDVMLGGLLNWIKVSVLPFVVPARADRFGTWL